MITMRYGTYRRSVLPASVLLGLCFLGMIFFRAESWGVIFEVLCWVIGVAGGLFQLVVSALRALGKLEFTYTDADRTSMLYSAEQLHREMKERRSSRKND